MKKLNIAILSLLLLASLSVKSQTQMQQEFERFLEKIPTIEWMDINQLFIKGTLPHPLSE